MSEPKKTTGGDGRSAPPEEREVERLLERAGPRPEVPQAHLHQIKAAFREQWERQVGRRPAGPRRVAASEPEFQTSASRTAELRRLATRTPGRRRSRAPAGRLLPLAAGVLLALGAAWWWWRPAPPPGPAGAVAHVQALDGRATMWPAGDRRTPPAALAARQAVPAGAELETAGAVAAEAGRAALRLAAGPEVRLDTGTRVRLVSAGVVELRRGAVYVDTGAGPEAAGGIEVRAAGGVVRDIGTRFEVRLLETDSGTLRVRVRDGAVEVEHGEGTWQAESGGELLLDAGGAVERRQIDPHGPEWSWVLEAAPRFDIEGRTLAEFLDWLAQETGWEVRFADPALSASAGAVLLHGTLPDVTPDQTPAVVLPGAGLRHELAGGVLLIEAADAR